MGYESLILYLVGRSEFGKEVRAGEGRRRG